MKLLVMVFVTVVTTQLWGAEEFKAVYQCKSSDPIHRSFKITLTKDKDKWMGLLEDLKLIYKDGKENREVKFSAEKAEEIKQSMPGYSVLFLSPSSARYWVTFSPMIAKTFNREDSKDWLREFQGALFHQVKESFYAAACTCLLEKL